MRGTYLCVVVCSVVCSALISFIRVTVSGSERTRVFGASSNEVYSKPRSLATTLDDAQCISFTKGT